MSAFGPAATATRRAPVDLTKHVNYVLGMVLGVDDFTQEFAYLSERDRWLARDLLGYGTAWGLAVRTQEGPRGPEVRVSPGVAVSPRGQLLRVVPTQCASLNDWLTSRAGDVASRLPGDAAPGVRLKLYVVLCYRECATDPVPIPGEPCRSEEDATAPSRLADDFKLELRFDPPEQQEEDALRGFVAWLRTHLQRSPTPGSSLPLEDFLDALREAAELPPGSPPESPPGSPPESPPGSPPFSPFDTPPASPLVVAEEDLRDYLRAALRLWVTELRPAWRTHWLGEAHGCTEALTEPPPGGEDCVLLAGLDIPLTRELGGGPWLVATSFGPITVEEDNRPFLAHLRLLQEWMLGGLQPGPATSRAVTHPPGLGTYSIIAAGIVPADPDVTPDPPAYNGLRAVSLAAGTVTFFFNGYVAPPGGGFQYVVKALPVSTEALPVALVAFGGFTPGGFVLRVLTPAGPVPQATLAQLQFVLEVSQYPLG